MKTMMNETPNEISITKSRGNNKMKKFTKLFKNEKGLTLIELLAVIVILAIVAAIAVPSISGVIDNSRYNAVKADATNILNAAQLYFVEDGENTAVTLVTVEGLKTAGYLESEGKIPLTAEIAKSKPLALSKATVKYSGEKAVTFTGATLKGIIEDEQKGSTDTAKTVIGKGKTE
ncbi:competence type IV pilus major pilin ComGC [Psychrobacillus antarcticus]|uniref:competence type IV pilus major pilin ComGC n=1 Tax=Psychrobacillus antarcticus TaxID=2879115 RepID=UPI00240806BE|nr:type II secretion system protein [Psychrobacillus antarcticus]